MFYLLGIFSLNHSCSDMEMGYMDVDPSAGIGKGLGDMKRN
jgi:hypothetical protein